MTAAINCRRQGGDVLLAERLSKPGKKILASGGGRCNLLNAHLEPEAYNEAARKLVAAVFAVYGKQQLLEFMGGLGLEITADGDRLFPATNQSASVVRAFELEIERLAIPVEFNCEAVSVVPEKSGITVLFSNGTKVECAKLILAGGGKSYPALGSNGSCLRIAKSLGHRIIEPVPSCVALCVQDKLCHHLQGQKITAVASCLVDGKPAASSEGELLFTQYGLSGTAVLDVSTEVAIALFRRKRKDVTLSVDLVPFLDKETLTRKIAERLAAKIPVDDLLTGILPNKFSHALSDLLRSNNAAKIAGALKDRRFEVTGTRGWNEAEFTSGGVDTDEVEHSTLASKLVPGVYFCGEMLDVDGRRGGYNLAWAWASGLAASTGTLQKGTG
jgi:predicted Rossmann fold flavoprotein